MRTHFRVSRLLKQLSISFASLFCSSLFAWDFQYSYASVFQPNADDYVVSQANIQKTHDPYFMMSYYAPINPELPAQVTYEFNLGAPITDAYLFSEVVLWDYFSGCSASGSIWGSKDGNSWDLLTEAPGPSASSYNFYNGALPASLLGSDTIWLQARLQSDGNSVKAMFSRTDDEFEFGIFSFNANVVPEPSTWALMGLGCLGFWTFVRFRR